MNYINRYLFLALIGIIATFSTLNTAYSATITAEIVDIPNNNKAGQVLFKNPTDSKFKLAKIKDKISENGIIATGKDSKATVDVIINFGNSKSFLRISNNTFLKLSPNEDKLQIAMGKGKVLVQNQSNAHKVNVSLGNYVAASEGTTFSAELDENPRDANDLNSSIDVLEGKVKFWNPDQTSAKPEYVLPGEKFRLNFRMGSTPMARRNNAVSTLNQSLNELKGKNIFTNDQINRMSQRLNKMSSSGLTIKQQNIQNFKIDLSSSLYNRRNMLKENIQKIDANKVLQNKGLLRQNNETIRKGIAQRIDNRLQNMNPLTNQVQTGNQNTQPTKAQMAEQLGLPSKGQMNNQNNSSQNQTGMPSKGQMNNQNNSSQNQTGMPSKGQMNNQNNSSQNQTGMPSKGQMNNQNSSSISQPKKWKVNQSGSNSQTNSNTISQPSRNESGIKKPKKYSQEEIKASNQQNANKNQSGSSGNTNMPPMKAGKMPPVNSGTNSNTGNAQTLPGQGQDGTNTIQTPGKINSQQNINPESANKKINRIKKQLNGGMSAPGKAPSAT